MNTVGRGISKRALAQSLVTRLQSSVSSSSTPEIQIPPRIERGPTDILKALERTINRDYTAPHYKYHDDPYLIPYSNASKRTYALAEEAGRKAAMWIRDQNRWIFNHKTADPLIESFLPKALYTKENASEDVLKNLIADAHVTDALNVYGLLEENVSIETKQSLLELLCYYNNAQPEDEELLQEQWYKQIEKRSTWKSCAVTEALFDFLKQQDKKVASKAYSAMICGTAKFINVNRAWALFEEAEKNNYPLSVTAYNSIIITLTNFKDNVKDRATALRELLQKMKAAGVQPNIGTFNAALNVAAFISPQKAGIDLCRNLFAEFNHIGVKPSLASYNYALKTFYKKGGMKSSLLREIINELQDKSFTIQDKYDTNFFVTAMDIAANDLEDAALGNNIHKLLLTGDNYNFLSNGYAESIYYRHYVMLQVKNQSLDEFMSSCYDIIVPHIYTPEPSVMDAILSAVQANDPQISRPLLPRFWTHIVQFDQLERKNLVAKALNLMRTHCRPDKDSPLNKMFCEAGWTVWNYVMSHQERRLQKMSWNGSILGDIAVLSYRAEDFEKCHRIVSYLFNEQNSVIGTPEPAQINELLEGFILNCHVNSAIDLVHYCSDNGYEDTASMAYKIWRNLSLNEWQENRLKSLVGPEVLKKRSGETQ